MVDLNKYSLEELYDLNKRVVAQIRAAQKDDAKEKSLKFKVGQEVWFTDRNGKRVNGVLTRFLPKNLAIRVEDPKTGHVVNWKVSPHLVKSVEPIGVDDVLGDLGGKSVDEFERAPEIHDKPKTSSHEAW